MVEAMIGAGFASGTTPVDDCCVSAKVGCGLVTGEDADGGETLAGSSELSPEARAAALPVRSKPNPSAMTNARMLTQATPTRQNQPAGRSRHCGRSEGERTWVRLGIRLTERTSVRASTLSVPTLRARRGQTTSVERPEVLAIDKARAFFDLGKMIQENSVGDGDFDATYVGDCGSLRWHLDVFDALLHVEAERQLGE